MQLVRAKGEVNVLDAAGNAAYDLAIGETYVLYDHEAGFGMRDGALRRVASLDSKVPAYRGEPLIRQRLLAAFIGGQGDAVALGSCLQALHDRFPEITIDIACLSAARGVFELMPRFGELLEYPIRADRLDAYDYHLSFEDIEAVRDGPRLRCTDLFRRCLKTPPVSGPVSLTVPPDARSRLQLPPTDRPRVAVHPGRPNSLRSYPADLTRELVAGLAAGGVDVFLVGANDATPKAADVDRPTERIHDFVNRTPSVGDLAALLSRMDVVVTSDSFPLHLAGALGVETLALFTSTDAVIAMDYPCVTAVRSGESCSPCRVADGACPLGHSGCVAHHNATLSPQRIAEYVRAHIVVSA